MPVITLPDGSSRQFDNAITVYDVAADIGAGLAKATLAGVVDGREVDASHSIQADAELRIITSRDDQALEILRHSTAHVLAQAVQQLFPGTQVTIGPTVEDGFYYDFASEHNFSLEDLEKIEAKMQELVTEDLEVSRLVYSREQAVELFREMGEHYKVQIIEELPEGEEISVYKQGDWMDLCRGPHVPSTGKLGAFRLTKVAGAYWRGDANNQQLQRIYGTAWSSPKELKAYLNRIAEAEKRDHRKIGRKLGLFHFADDAPGSVFWHPKGWTLFRELLEYMRCRQDAAGYVEVNTPDVMDRSLWETSGHWFNYRENMFSTQTEDERIFALKPMNCPGSVSMFAQGLKSYRDLPLRMAEFGKVHRYEPSGALHGLMRVRHFTQDDAHIYCTEQQMEQECIDVVALVLDIYKDFGFDDVVIKLSTRPENRIGSDAVWDKLEGALSNALDVMGLDYVLFPGEGAFYGPKLEFVLRDAIGRDWQCGTLQVDMNLPERFDITYVDEDGNRDKRPVMLHRALFGSLERFIGILIEHFEGNFPVWLAPQQAVVVNITDKQRDYAEDVVNTLKAQGFRVVSDLRNEKVGFKIREAELSKMPYVLVVGEKEREAGMVAVRGRHGSDLGVMSISDFGTHLQAEVANKSVVNKSA
ncbi:MAG: threonine--tRNA ligase [Gammaproteobacteria bacterium]|nr:threonine--tRNA ligase [Gammaproteobacteria bacterium]